MIDLKALLFTQGLMLLILAIGMVVCLFTDLIFLNSQEYTFVISLLITIFFAGIMILAGWGYKSHFSVRHGFIMVVTSWLMTSIFGSLPFMLMADGLSFTKSMFETMSGLSSTGSTVMSDLDNTQEGILLWRAFLQWYGGLGIMVMTLAFMPTMRIGGMQVFKAESFETADKVMPRAAELGFWLCIVYVVLTLTWAIIYYILGMNAFEALVHSMTTLSTGGYSSSDLSFQYFDSYYLDMWAAFGMIIGSLPFVYYIKFIRSGTISGLLKDSQVRFFIGLVTTLTIVITIYLHNSEDYSYSEAFRYGFFNLVSIITGTGYVNYDFSKWGTFALFLIFFAMFSGGCSGSTSCGIKVFRLQIMYEGFKVQVKQMIYPNGVFQARFNGKVIDDDIIKGVMGFFLMYMITFIFLSLGLSLCGFNFVTALASAATALSCVGPSLGQISPVDDFANVSSAAKWLMFTGMLMGRLEIYSVFILFVPTFWRR